MLTGIFAPPWSRERSHKNINKLSVNANPKLCFLTGDNASENLAHQVAVKSAIQPFFGEEERTEFEIRKAGSPLLSFEEYRLVRGGHTNYI
ncbi:hypothetical protein ACOSQ4_009123 [Xanthoceras sorbifolium]